MMRPDIGIVLILGGGNALGGFQLGVWDALAAAGYEPDWIIGTSIGAINGAVIAGNAPADRAARLERLWRSGGPFAIGGDHADTARRTAAVAWTLAAGRPGLVTPAMPWATWWAEATPSLFDTASMPATLAGLIDFDRLNNGGGPRYTACAVDLERGEEVFLDTLHDRISPDHVRASAALPVLFPAVEIDGRMLVDGGMAANLPLDPFFREPVPRPTLCIAVDMLPAGGPMPRTLGEVAGRAQDLALGIQSRRSLDRWRATYPADAAGVTLARLAYADQRQEVAGKAFDFSPRSIQLRRAAGYAQAGDLLRRIATGDVVTAERGLTII